MSRHNIPTDGYGLTGTETAYRPNVPTNGYGQGLFLGYIEYLITLADYLLYQATLGGGVGVILALTDAAVRVAASAEATAAVLDEAETVVSMVDADNAMAADEYGVDLSIDDRADSATIGETATTTMADRATVVTLTDTKVG